jgi:hypothetical protein
MWRKPSATVVRLSICYVLFAAAVTTFVITFTYIIAPGIATKSANCTVNCAGILTNGKYFAGRIILSAWVESWNETLVSDIIIEHDDHWPDLCDVKNTPCYYTAKGNLTLGLGNGQFSSLGAKIWACLGTGCIIAWIIGLIAMTAKSMHRYDYMRIGV